MLEKKPLAGRRGQHPDICGSHARGSTQTQRRRPGRPPSHLQSRWTRDRAVTAGALSHGTTAAHRCRRTACARTIRQPGQTGQDGAQVRTAAMEAGCSRASPSRCVLRSVTHLWADFVAAHAHVRQGRLFTCLPQAGSSRYVPCPLHGGACPRNLRVDLTCARANATLGKLHLDRRTWS